MSDKNTATYRGREPFTVRPSANGVTIWSGPTVNDAILAEVYDKGPCSFDHEEMAKVWAASYQIMFPALAEIRNAAREKLSGIGGMRLDDDVRELLSSIAETAAAALPVPTIGDVNGTAPEAPRRSSVQEAATDLTPEKRARDLLKTIASLDNLLISAASISAIATAIREAVEAARAVAPQEAPAEQTITAAKAAARQGQGALAKWWNGATREQRLQVIDGARHLLSLLGGGAPAGVPEGWKLVPVEPTPEMEEAGYWNEETSMRTWAEAYRAMLSAAPASPTPTAQGQDPLGKVRQAIADYHYALDTRQHGGTAAHQAIDAIKAHLGIAWEPGAEKARRSSTSTPDVPVAVAPPEAVPVRCGTCGWLGDAAELGQEGECGGDERCTGRPAEITDPADMLKAWQDSEGLICGDALADAGLIEPTPATSQDAAMLDDEEGDTVWHITAAGQALLDARRSSAPSAGEA